MHSVTELLAGERLYKKIIWEQIGGVCEIISVNMIS